MSPAALSWAGLRARVEAPTPRNRTQADQATAQTARAHHPARGFIPKATAAGHERTRWR